MTSQEMELADQQLSTQRYGEPPEPSSAPYNPRPYTQSEVRPLANVPEQVWKWGMRYNGRSGTLGFLEDLEERAISHGISLDPWSEVFCDRAARWLLSSGGCAMVSI